MHTAHELIEEKKERMETTEPSPSRPHTACEVDGQRPASRSHIGNCYPFVQAYADRQPTRLSYLSEEWLGKDLEEWRCAGRAKMLELLAYAPEAAALDPVLLGETHAPGYTRLHMRYHVTADRETEAFLLIPDGLDRPAPAVVALHDHGGFYYFGKEKITETEAPLGCLQEHIDRAYGGRAFADELARRGFVVLVPDAFYFGSQRLELGTLPDEFTAPIRGLAPGSNAYVAAHREVAGPHEELVAKTILAAGATWPGILFQGDRASVDFLLTRPEVDSERIGCMGLSIGGFRSAHLFGLDERIKAGVVAGWMTTYGSLLYDHLLHHTWMVYVPGQLAWLDLPDVVCLNAPRPLMVLNCLQDLLFTLDGMKDAECRIRDIYAAANHSARFRCAYYDEPHSMKIPAQNDAIAWLEGWLMDQETGS